MVFLPEQNFQVFDMAVRQELPHVNKPFSFLHD